MSPAQVAAFADFNFCHREGRHRVTLRYRKLHRRRGHIRSKTLTRAGWRTADYSCYFLLQIPISLHVGDFAIQKSHLQILIHINHFRPQVDDLIRLAQGSLHLVGGLSLFNSLRLRLRLFLRGWLLLTSLRLRALIPTLLLLLISALLLPAIALLHIVIADREQCPDRILDLSRARGR